MAAPIPSSLRILVAVSFSYLHFLTRTDPIFYLRSPIASCCVLSLPRYKTVGYSPLPMSISVRHLYLSAILPIAPVDILQVPPHLANLALHRHARTGRSSFLHYTWRIIEMAPVLPFSILGYRPLRASPIPPARWADPHVPYRQ